MSEKSKTPHTPENSEPSLPEPPEPPTDSVPTEKTDESDASLPPKSDGSGASTPDEGGSTEPPSLPPVSRRKPFSDPEEERKRNRARRTVHIWMIGVHIVLLIISIVLIIIGVKIPYINQGAGVIIITTQILHWSLSLLVVREDQFGVILFFRKPIYVNSSGLAIVPFGFCQLRQLPTVAIQRQFPAEPEMIDKTRSDEKIIDVTNGFVRPVRITTGSESTINPEYEAKYPKLGKDPLHRRITTEITWIVRFMIKDPIAFIENVGSIEEADRQMRDTSESVLRLEFGMRTMPIILIEQNTINKGMKEKIEVLVGERRESRSVVDSMKSRDDTDSMKEPWGINIIDTHFLEPDLSHKLNESLRDIPKARADAEKAVTTAEASKNAKILEGDGEESFLTSKGKGDANALEEKLLAEAVGAQAMAEVLRTPEGKLGAQLRVAQGLASNPKNVIVQEGLTGIASTLKSVIDAVKEEKGT